VSRGFSYLGAPFADGVDERLVVDPEDGVVRQGSLLQGPHGSSCLCAVDIGEGGALCSHEVREDQTNNPYNPNTPNQVAWWSRPCSETGMYLVSTGSRWDQPTGAIFLMAAVAKGLNSSKVTF